MSDPVGLDQGMQPLNRKLDGLEVGCTNLLQQHSG